MYDVYSTKCDKTVRQNSTTKQYDKNSKDQSFLKVRYRPNLKKYKFLQIIFLEFDWRGRGFEESVFLCFQISFNSRIVFWSQHFIKGEIKQREHLSQKYY